MKYRKVTIIDDHELPIAIKFFGMMRVAREAGIDHAEVSRAITGSRVISEAVYIKLWATVRALEARIHVNDLVGTNSKSESDVSNPQSRPEEVL